MAVAAQFAQRRHIPSEEQLFCFCIAAVHSVQLSVSGEISHENDITQN